MIQNSGSNLALESSLSVAATDQIGRSVCITHGRGGCGSTSIAVSLAAVAHSSQKRVLLWDLDLETADLSYYLGNRTPQSHGRDCRALAKALTIDLSECLSVVNDLGDLLSPPKTSQARLTLALSTELPSEILTMAVSLYDLVVVDLAGSVTPATISLMKHADEVLVVTDHTDCGLAALDRLLNALAEFRTGISVLVNGSLGGRPLLSEVFAQLESKHHLGTKAWSLPPIPVDSKASMWMGTKKTLFEMGSTHTQAAIRRVAEQLGAAVPTPPPDV